jgi:hypothetical protein
MCNKNYLNKGYVFFYCKIYHQTLFPETKCVAVLFLTPHNSDICHAVGTECRKNDATGVPNGIMSITNFVKICQLALNSNLEQGPQPGDLMSQLPNFKEYTKKSRAYLTVNTLHLQYKE